MLYPRSYDTLYIHFYAFYAEYHRKYVAHDKTLLNKFAKKNDFKFNMICLIIIMYSI